MSEALVIFAGAAGPGWLLLKDGVVVSRGPSPSDATGATVPSRDDLPVVVAVPGESVALHWIDLPTGLSEPQAIAAARLACGSLASQPIENLHVAVGAAASERRIAGLVATAQMAQWIADARALGLNPDLVIPDVLFLPERPGHFVRYDRNGISLLRGEGQAFAIEAEVSDLVLDGDRKLDFLSSEEFEAGMISAVAAPALNLLQGRFAGRRRWKADRRWLRRMALMAVALMLLTFAAEVIKTIRYSLAADGLELEREEILRGAIGGGLPPGSSNAVIAERLRRMGGSKGDFDRLIETLFGAIQATPSVELTQLEFSEDGILRATVEGISAADVMAVPSRLDQNGFLMNVQNVQQPTGHPAVRFAIRSQ